MHEASPILSHAQIRIFQMIFLTFIGYLPMNPRWILRKLLNLPKQYAQIQIYPKKMRAYALEHLDWSAKMKKLKAFLETLVDE